MIPRFLHPLLVYRSFAVPFLVLSATTVPCWLVVRLVRRRNPANRPSFRREILLLTFVVYLSGLATATLIPNHSSRYRAEATVGVDFSPNLASLTCSSTFMPSGSTAQSFCVRNARGNVLLFVPLGILILLVWRQLRFWRGVFIAIAVSCAIELVQYLSRSWINRSADINDVVLNVVGACLGLALVSLARRMPIRRFGA